MTHRQAVALARTLAALSVGGCASAHATAATPTPAAPSALASAGISDALPMQLDSLMIAAIADHASPGITLAIGRHGRIVYTNAWGSTDWAPGAPRASDSTMYDLASLTKVVATTTAAMLMEEDGRLDIERTVVSYLPEFSDPAKASMTVRMLLTHTSGMKQFQNLWKEIKGRQAYLQRINASALAHPPGEVYEYSDWNMLVLQQVVERVAGRMLDTLLDERVFGPLGMRDTRFNLTDSLKPRIAPTETEDFRGGQVWGVVHDENAWSMGGVSGNAGLFSSARDLAVFEQMMLDGGEYNGRRILRPETIARWTARQRRDVARALGWETPSPRSSAGRYFSPRSFGHTGFTGTSLWADPEKQVFVVLLSNRVNPTRDNTKLGPIRRAVADLVQAAILDAPLTLWETPVVAR